MRDSRRWIRPAAAVFVALLSFAPLRASPQGGPGLVLHAAAIEGAAAPSGGQWRLSPWANPMTLAPAGRHAFVASVDGALHDQGVFVGDAAGLRIVARACGRGGGSGGHGACGDPAPGGGTFGGFFEGAAFAPAVTSDGNVLFLADVLGGPSSRALFGWDEAAGQLSRVVGVGDPCPQGGVFAAIGPGVHAPAGGVLFLARRQGRSDGELYLHQGGTTAPFVVAGDPLPGGGSVQAVATESLHFTDGTDMPTGPLPAVDGCGNVAVRVLGAGGAPSQAILVRGNGGDALWLSAGMATPAGGAYLGFGSPRLAPGGDLCVFADHSSAAGPTAGWFVGRPGSWRRALGFFDPLDGGHCLGLALSRGPMAPLDDDGSLLLWCDLSIQGGADRLVRCRADGTVEIVARRGDATPLGGYYGALGAWPSVDATGRASYSAQIQGGAVAGAQFTAVTPAVRLMAAPCASQGAPLSAELRGPPQGASWLFASLLRTSLPIPTLGQLGIGPDQIVWLAGPEPCGVDWQARRWQWPTPAQEWRGLQIHFQALVWEPASGSAWLSDVGSAWLR